MAIPSQDLIKCKRCGEMKPHHPQRRLYCVECTHKLQVEYQRVYRAKLMAQPRLKVCKFCGNEFDVSEHGRSHACQPCITARQAEDRRRNLERHAQYSRAYRERMGSAYTVKMRQRRGDALAKMTPDEATEFRRKESEKSQRIAATVRAEIFANYGFKCACCGETEPKFLTIDHIANNSAEMRRNGEHGQSGTSFYQYLRRNNFPAGFQTLCMNCNLGKHRNGGICPHQSGKV